MQTDFEEIKARMVEILENAGITYTVVKMGGRVDDNNWPHVAFSVSFFRREKCVGDFVWRIGIGHAKIPGRKDRRIEFFARELGVAEADIWAYDRLKDKQKSADIASFFTSTDSVFAPEVLARVLADKPESDFEEWAQEFGYDTDSIKAKGIYDDCLHDGFNAEKIVPPEFRAELIELVNSL